MSDEDLEVLITLDDPGEEQQEDTFNHLQAENNFEYWLGQPSRTDRLDHRAEAIIDDPTVINDQTDRSNEL